MFVVYWGEVLVAMFSTLNLPSGTNKYGHRVHRTVVLPDFQGLGIGTKLLDFFGEYYLSRGEKLYLRSTHLRFANHCLNSNKWIEGGRSKKSIREDQITTSQGQKYKNQNTKRQPYSFEYVGEAFNTIPKQYILCLGNPKLEEAQLYIERIVDKNKYPIIVSSIASVEYVNSFEKIAKQKGYRTEVLFIKNKGEYIINSKYKNIVCDAIVIGRKNQLRLKELKNSKDFNSLITYFYNKEPPIYYERINKGN